MPNPIINQLTIKSGNQTILYDIGVNAENVELADESTLQDKLDEKQDILTFDETPTRDSENPVTSGGVYNSLDVKLNKSAVGVPEGAASLDSNGKVPITQLPSYVDDVVEYPRKSEFPSTGEREKIYIALDTNLTYRLGGSEYVEISPSLALGTTSSTALRGDLGYTAYQHATDNGKINTAKASGLYKVAGTAQGHIASLTDVTKSDITALGIPAQDTTYDTATITTNGLMSSTDKTKLDNIPATAEENQNAFSFVKVGNTNMAADSKTDTFTLEAGSNITLTPDTLNDKAIISATVNYGDSAGTACEGNDPRLSDARTPVPHNQAANTITEMTGYVKPASTSAINTSDSLNSAIGKLEKGLENADIPIATINQAGKVKPDGTTITIDVNGTITSVGGDLSNYIQKSSTSGLVKNDGTIDINEYAQISDLSNYIEKSATEGLVKNDGTIDTSKHVHLQPTGSELTGELQAKTWSELSSINGQSILSDGDNIYYSDNSDQYVLDKSTSTWSIKTWSGLSDFAGGYIWNEGENTYFSHNRDQYVLDKSTSTLNTKTWYGSNMISAIYIWTDGENIYFSSGSAAQTVLDRSTSTWSSKTWNGLTNFYGNDILTDGENIYYSNGTNHYVLDKSTSTLNIKTWNGLTSFRGFDIWTDGNNIYYSSYGNKNYILDKSTSTWSTKTWSGFSDLYGEYVWTDGKNIYHSNGSTYVFISEAAYADGFVKTDGTIDTFPKRFIASTTDLEDGVSPLETGVIYLVYEDA